MIYVIEVELLGVRPDVPTRAPAVLLREVADQRRVLPIFIGVYEAEAITLALRKVVPPRPLTHDLLKSVIEEMGASVERVVITELRERTFFAELHLRSGAGPLVISCRPSDSLAVAARVGCKVFVAGAVLEQAGQVPVDEEETPSELLDEFRAFIADVNPDDFAS